MILPIGYLPPVFYKKRFFRSSKLCSMSSTRRTSWKNNFKFNFSESNQRVTLFARSQYCSRFNFDFWHEVLSWISICLSSARLRWLATYRTSCIVNIFSANFYLSGWKRSAAITRKSERRISELTIWRSSGHAVAIGTVESICTNKQNPEEKIR